jgi:hypothetical protein
MNQTRNLPTGIQSFEVLRTVSLKAILSDNLDRWEALYGKNEREKTLSRRFEGVIRRAYEKTGKRVVVLIDEYDKPMLSTILNESLSKKYRTIMKAFYGFLYFLMLYINNFFAINSL